MGATPEHVFFCVADPGVDVCDTKVSLTELCKTKYFGDNSYVEAALAHRQGLACDEEIFVIQILDVGWQFHDCRIFDFSASPSSS